MHLTDGLTLSILSVSFICLIVSGNGSLHIEITRRRSIYLNGVEIDENSLPNHLRNHERLLIYGKEKEDREAKLVHLTEVDSEEPTRAVVHVDLERYQREKQKQRYQRVKRHNTRNNSGNRSLVVSVEIHEGDVENLVHFHLHQTPNLIDNAFTYIRRYTNSTEFVENSHKLVRQYENCFYSNENSALDFCDKDRVRGVIHHNTTNFFITPLPRRFGKFIHVVVPSKDQRTFLYNGNLIKTGKTDINPLSEYNRPNDNGKHMKARKQILENNSATKEQHIRERHHNSIYAYGYDQDKNRWRHMHSTKHHDTHYIYHRRNRSRRHLLSNWQEDTPHELYIETAIFVDSDLIKHMAKNFPKNTENYVIRFVLALINGVQVLYHHPSLGHRINYVLKRLEILYKEPHDLKRSSDIDMYLSNFCIWQKHLNPTSDANVLHYDHAVILTGLDLYVVGKNGKAINQVVGLAPVAGMCTTTSSCTINEGKHFESVFVVAHEIGHNLGMRHDTRENNCDPSLYIMSPTLGSGKITWSQCSRTYLNTFLRSHQAKCLFDRGEIVNNLDHSLDGVLPGERFDAHQQCILKYGKGAFRSQNQVISDICRDLHCQRDSNTWTSHPALEGTICGKSKWCRSGICVLDPKALPLNSTLSQPFSSTKARYDIAELSQTSNAGHLLHSYKDNQYLNWSEWGSTSNCESGCLYGSSKRLIDGSTGLKTYSRTCMNDYRRECQGKDRKYESCTPKQCSSVAITTVEDFATQVCQRAQRLDNELNGKGLQIIGGFEESCKVYCSTIYNGTKSHSWTFPDGTRCRSTSYIANVMAYCITGRCEQFSCDNSNVNYYKIDEIFCHYNHKQLESVANYKSDRNNKKHTSHNILDKSVKVHSQFENEISRYTPYGTPQIQSYETKPQMYQGWHKYIYQLSDGNNIYSPHTLSPPTTTSVNISTPELEWKANSICQSSCMLQSKGVQVVTSQRTGVKTVKLCTPSSKFCGRLQSAIDYAGKICTRYKLKVRGLSGHGMQIAASINEPDRSCRIGCQDELLQHRFYLVNGKNGHFPLGTKCSRGEDHYCVNGKCIEFGHNSLPLQRSHAKLELRRSRRSASRQIYCLACNTQLYNVKRSGHTLLYHPPTQSSEVLVKNIANDVIQYEENIEKIYILDSNEFIIDHIAFNNPIYIPTVLSLNGEVLSERGKQRPINIENSSIKLSTIRIWMHERDIGNLSKILWAGQGNRLLQQASTNAKIKRFLMAVPYVMVNIKNVHQAIINNKMEILQALLVPPAHPSLITSRDVNGLSVMHKAAGLGHTKILEYLIEIWPEGLHKIDCTGRTPLHWAASTKNNMRCYNLLTQAGCEQAALDCKLKAPSYYRHKPNDIERAFLVIIPEAPRVTSEVETDWEALSDGIENKVPQENMANGKLEQLNMHGVKIQSEVLTAKDITEKENLKRHLERHAHDVRTTSKITEEQINIGNIEDMDSRETDIKDLVAAGNLEQLAQTILNGDGNSLIGTLSPIPEIQAFLSNVSNYMSKIRRIHEAAREGDIEDLQKNLDRRKFAVAKDKCSPNGATPLHVAVLFGHYNIVRYLAMRFPETMSTSDDNLRTALHYAATIQDNGHFYNMLCSLGANSHATDKFGRTAEYYVENEESENAFTYHQLLKDFGAEYLVEKLLNDQGEVEYHYLEENEFLVTEQGKYLEKYLAAPLIQALKEISYTRPENPIEFLAGFLQQYEHPSKFIHQQPIDNNNTNTSSNSAISSLKKFSASNKSLINNQDERSKENAPTFIVNPLNSPTLDDRDEHGQSMLHFASARSHQRGSLMNLIQESGVDITYRDELYRTARDVALQANQPGNAKDIDNFVLSLAVVGDVSQFEYFLIAGYDHIIDIMNDDSESIMDVAAKMNHEGLVSFLKNLRSVEEQREQLHQVIREGNLDTVRNMALSAKGKWLIKAKNYYGRNALHVAVLKESEGIVESLVGICPEALKIGDNIGRTALHYAMAMNAVEALSRLLIQNGANRTIKDLKGRQPSYYFMNKADIWRLQEEEFENR